MIIQDRIYRYFPKPSSDIELSFLKMPNTVDNIAHADKIFIGCNLMNFLTDSEFSDLMDLDKGIIIDYSYELVEASVLNRLLKYKNLSHVEYYCIPRQDIYEQDTCELLIERGLRIYYSQYFADFSDYFNPVISSPLAGKPYCMHTGKVTPERTMLVALLSYYNILDQGYVSFFGDTNVDKNFDQGKINDLFNRPDLINADDILKKTKIGLNRLRWPLILDEPMLTFNVSTNKNFNADYYLASEFVIVPETGLNNKDIFFISEKTVKPILLNKKIIVLSHKNYIKNLKLYYKTKLGKDISHLTDWCDTSYDDEEDLALRIEMIVAEVKKHTVQKISEINLINNT